MSRKKGLIMTKSKLSVDIGDYKITANAYNFILNEKHVHGPESKTPGEEKLRAIGFYGSLKHLCTEAVRLKLRESDAKSVLELITALSACYELIRAIDDSKDYEL